MISDECPRISVDFFLLRGSQGRCDELEKRLVVLVSIACHLFTRELYLLFLRIAQRGVIVLETLPQILNLVLHNLVDLLLLVIGQCRVRQAR